VEVDFTDAHDSIAEPHGGKGGCHEATSLGDGDREAGGDVARFQQAVVGVGCIGDGH
jgi:hypothetical protein